MRSVVAAVVERTDAMALFLLSSVSLIAWAAASANATNSNYADRVLLSEVMAITLIDGHMTKTRHNSSVPQLVCVGGEAGCLGDVPTAVLCINGGQNKQHNRIKWKCSSGKDLEENGLELVQLNVSCEGYNHPNDPYIVKGSCSLSYELDWSDNGLTAEDGQSFSNMLSWIVLIVVGVMWILLILCCLALRYCEIPSKSPPNSVEAHMSSSSTAYLIPQDYNNGYQPIDGAVGDSSSSNSVTPEVHTMIR